MAERDDFGRFIKGHKRPKEWIDANRAKTLGTKRNSLLLHMGHKQTEETKRKIREAQIGIPRGKTWNKGLTKETSEGMMKTSKKLMGRCLSEGHKIKARLARLGKFHSKETKEKMREAFIKNIEKGLKSGNSMSPMMGKHEKSILDYLEECLTYKIIRQYKVNGYFIDGYCPALNLAIEVDEMIHKRENYMLKDLERENNIKNKLNCQFLRLEV